MNSEEKAFTDLKTHDNMEEISKRRENEESSLKSRIMNSEEKAFTHLKTRDKMEGISKKSKNEEISHESSVENKSFQDQWENIQEIVE